MPGRRRTNNLTPDDIIATLNRSSFPSVVTEGDDDVIVFRRLESEFSKINLTIIPAGGRNTILEVYRRRHEISPNSKFLFVADKDIWVLSGIPIEYIDECLIFTDGYSIENDMYRDGELENLLVGQELLNFKAEKDIVCNWYAAAITRILRDETTQLDIHPNEIIDSPARLSQIIGAGKNEYFDLGLCDKIKNEYDKVLRGKTLFCTILRQLRNHNIRILLNTGAARRGPLLTRLFGDVGQFFSRK